MIHLKDFYRKLGALLENIDEGWTKEDFLFSVISKLKSSFGQDLHIGNGRLYVEEFDQYLLVRHSERNETADQGGLTALYLDIVRLVIGHRSYIFDDQSLGINSKSDQTRDYTIPAVFLVHNPDKRWKFVFTLEREWIREEIEFCLNAVRPLLNYRLHATAMKNNMQQATLVRQSLLPSSLPQIGGYEIAAQSYPAEVVGGDFYDFKVFDNQVFSVAVGDASGHGVPAAIMVRDIVTGLHMGVEKEMKMAESLQKLNNVLHRSRALSSSFVSLFYGEIECNGNIFYVNASHILYHFWFIIQKLVNSIRLGLFSVQFLITHYIVTPQPLNQVLF